MAAESGSKAFGVLAVGFVAWFVVTGCAGKSMKSADGACSGDADCASGEVCAIPKTPSRQPAILMPCPYTYCTTREQCPGGFACAPTPLESAGGHSACGALSCLESCLVTGCATDEICGPSEVCELVPCDAVDAAACPAHWRCAPAASVGQTLTIAGSDVPDAPDPARAIRRGCARVRCDEPDGYACSSFFECEFERAPESTGCAPLPCDATGRCPDEANTVCAATSTVPPPGFPDAFGCVPRHCTQGYECRLDVFLGWGDGIANVLFCDPSAPDANSYGCASRTCEDVPEWCEPGRAVCDPGDPTANLFGCRATESGGTGGTSAGQGGSAGSQADTSGSGGSPSLGHCVSASSAGD